MGSAAVMERSPVQSFRAAHLGIITVAKAAANYEKALDLVAELGGTLLSLPEAKTAFRANRSLFSPFKGESFWAITERGRPKLIFVLPTVHRTVSLYLDQRLDPTLVAGFVVYKTDEATDPNPVFIVRR